ncbi:unnamed protein product, partial [marine sediment metagenome]
MPSNKVWLREDEVKGGHEHQWGRYYRLKLGDVFVEAGAYLCRYGRIASKRVGPEGRVILIEPSPPNIWWIKKVVKDMKLTNVTLLEKAVWNERTQIEFRIDGVPTGNRIVKTGYPQTAEIVKVEADTVDNILDDLGLDHVDLFAADVENAEIEMVQ